MAVDALQVANHVHVDGTGLDRFRPALAKARKMAVGGLRFSFADGDLFGHQAAGKGNVAGGEDVERQPQVLQHPAVEGLEFGGALGRKGLAVLDLLGGEFHQVLVDDVADMLEIRREGQNLDVAPAVLLAEFVA